MVALANIDLCDCCGAKALGHIGQHCDLDAPTLHERNLFDGAAASGELAAQRLVQPGEFGQEQAEQWSGHKLGGTAAAAEIGGAVIAGLHEGYIGGSEQRHEQTKHPAWLDAGDVAIAPQDEVSGACGQRGPEGIALAAPFAVDIVDCVYRHNGCAVSGRYGSRIVGRVVVEHNEFVDQAVAVDQHRSQHVHQFANGAGLVFTWKTHADGACSLGRERLTHGERR